MIGGLVYNCDLRAQGFRLHPSIAMAVRASCRKVWPVRRLRTKTAPPRAPRYEKHRRLVAQYGFVPKARQAFAIYFGKHQKVKKGASKAEFQAEMAELGQKWKALSDAERAPYKEQSREEFERKRQCWQAFGVTGPRGIHQKRDKLEDGSQNPDAVSNTAFQVGQYKVAEENCVLGKGTYGKVCLSTKDGVPVAIKLFHGRHGALEAAYEIQQYNLLRSLADYDRDWFPRMLEAHEDGLPCPYVVLTHCGKSLGHWLKEAGCFQAPAVRQIATQLKAGLQTLHTKAHILHLDIKPQNILWCKEISLLKLCDFGMVEPVLRRVGQASTALRFTVYVTAGYRPPELWSKPTEDLDGLREALTPAVDWWSYGCVVYEVGSGLPLFQPRNRNSESDLRACVFSWRAHWSKLQQFRGRDVRSTQLRQWHARLLICSSWAKSLILQACHPVPSHRGITSHPHN